MQQPVNFCDYIDNEVKNGRPDAIPAFCPVPKIKGLYYPTPKQLFDQFRNENCNITKKLPGTLGSSEAISNKMRQSMLLTTARSGAGRTQFVLNANSNGKRQGQPGGIGAPIRNRF